MSENQKKFKELLEKHYWFLKQYWVWNASGSGELQLEAARASLGKLSSGERVILCCLVAIWCGGLGKGMAAFKIDFSDLYGYVDPAERKPLLEWLVDPFWP